MEPPRRVIFLLGATVSAPPSVITSSLSRDTKTLLGPRWRRWVHPLFSHAEQRSQERTAYRHDEWPKRRVRVWWSTFEATEDDELPRKLFDKHGTWPSPIPEPLQAEPGPTVRLPIYDVDPLPVWYSGRAVPMGDAAQGVSLALEDAAVLGKCLQEAGTDVRAAFVEYENARRTRVTRVVEEGRRRGQAKREMGFIACSVRDIVVMLVVWWTTESAMDERFGYTVEEVQAEFK
ncbi:hypothetical protein BC936DRAFT_144992 [Jimgerdemannia flammicorona]|uniref:FAD-binding domain-containing protein n=1 Tax=Jimgerdemannia flammicorona TaxID=994334 RepID=A0A433DM35_9FUNG|nr:hypothetical protein BC936DRAFT_144992 [Jimgerdemannia flammicorona]